LAQIRLVVFEKKTQKTHTLIPKNDGQTDRINLFAKTKTKIRKAIQTRKYQITIIKLVGKRKT